ncbi:hypothetical protein CAL20_09680 [Bordetella genomosp. 4]|uniref:Uncharacterized protein n=1 Tax=Bordetella genomosp. 4 TaxID=463044 RepID=A0A261U6T4_9BORD|nr:hypothetical protein CAL20_09680 [Bordetella genomosp. 4]
MDMPIGRRDPEISATAICAAVAHAIKFGQSAFDVPGSVYAEHAFNQCVRDARDESDLAMAILDPASERGIRFRARYRNEIERLARGDHKR